LALFCIYTAARQHIAQEKEDFFFFEKKGKIPSKEAFHFHPLY
jgi:hypothetical protein